MWNKKRSLQLSKAVTLLFACLLLALFIFAPWEVSYFIQKSASAHQWQAPLFLTTIYTGGAAAMAILVLLYMVLHNIGRGQVFIAQNASLLRGISWLCIAGGAVALASAFYYTSWCFVAAAAAFMGLIVRVVKNVVAEAIALKEENDFTI